jgi:zinc transporter ZupT
VDWAFTGGVLQSITSDLLQHLASAQMAFSRGVFWGPVCVFGAMAWWLATGSQKTLSAKALRSVLIPVLMAMLAADIVAMLTSYLPHASSKAELMKAIQDKQAQDNALFFAIAAGVAAWRANCVLREQGTTNASRRQLPL